MGQCCTIHNVEQLSNTKRAITVDIDFSKEEKTETREYLVMIDYEFRRKNLTENANGDQQILLLVYRRLAPPYNPAAFTQKTKTYVNRRVSACLKDSNLLKCVGS